MALLRANSQKADTEAIKQTIITLFKAMRTGDVELLKSVYSEDTMLQSISNDKEGKAILTNENTHDLEKVIGTTHKAVYDERVAFYDIKVYGNIASVWAPYKFYIDERLSHTGVDIFQLMKVDEGWRIIHIVDTRVKPGKR